MRLDIKCLKETTAIIVVSLFIIKLAECKPQFGINDALETSPNEDALILESEKLKSEKRDQNEIENDLDELQKREWNSNFATWGKRWQNFASWGKRNPSAEYAVPSADGLHPIEKRGWFKFNSWGKRSADNTEADKRKWSNFASWGKREDENTETLPDKRKWSSFASWGKRLNNDEQELNGVPDSDAMEEDKRKWSSFASWGKRVPELTELDKRKWSSFASWGKREDLEEPDEKRWSQFSSWGKRRPYPYDWAKRRWAQFNTWGKRRWHGLATWGKRADPGLEKDSLAEDVVLKLLQFFDTNDDGVLDKEELAVYIRTLMSLPSSVEVENT